ncbi:hypothetical protein EP7_002316 [Isosphaeraceae bacterium EP7]
MSQSANVQSIESIRLAREALALFAEEARQAIGATQMEITRATDWLVNRQRMYWQEQIKRRAGELSMARTELHRKKLMKMSMDSVNDTEQQEIVRMATRRLREAEEKLELVKRWVATFQQAVAEYQSHGRGLDDTVNGRVQNGVAMLDRMMTAIDAYAAIAPPMMPTAPPMAPEPGGTTP